MREPIHEPNPETGQVRRGPEPLRYTSPAAVGEVRHAGLRHIDWTAIWSGMFVALGISVLLVSLAPAIGVGLGDTGAAIWGAISLIIGFFVGGWVVGQTTDVLDSRSAIIHGILMWAIARVLTLVLALVVTTIFLSSSVNGLLGLVPFLAGIVGQLARSPVALAVGAAGNAAPANPGAAAAAVNAAATAAANAAVSASWVLFLIMLVSLIAAVAGALVGNRAQVVEPTPR